MDEVQPISKKQNSWRPCRSTKEAKALRATLSENAKRRLHRIAAHALFTAGSVRKAARKLQEETGENWTHNRLWIMTKHDDFQQELARLHKQEQRILMHNAANLVENLIIASNFDRTQLYESGTFQLKPFSEWPEEAKVILDGVDFKIGKDQVAVPVAKLVSKMDAWEKLGKELGAWKERREVTGKDGGPIQLEAISSAKELLASRIARLVTENGAGGLPQLPEPGTGVCDQL